MPSPATIEEFLGLIERGSVADPVALKKAMDRWKETKSHEHNGVAELAAFLVNAGVITEFHKEQLLAGRFRGFKIGQYRILSLLGIGGMGRVFLAEHVFMRRQVALKVLPKTQNSGTSTIERFMREARSIAALNHPNIVQAYDSGQDGEVFYLAMEYVNGMSLHEYVQKFGPVPWRHACDFIRQAAEGLQHAADCGLVHRDIKPGNLLLDQTGVVKLLDLGLAVSFAEQLDEHSLTVKYNENVLGTADYLAPEQAVDSHKIDIRADIYSLGGTFYYLLSGQAPFPTGTITQKLLWHQQKEPQSLAELIPDLPADLVTFIRLMMAKDPDKRPEKPSEVARILTPASRAMTAPFSRTPTPISAKLQPSTIKPPTVERAKVPSGQQSVRTRKIVENENVSVAIDPQLDFLSSAVSVPTVSQRDSANTTTIYRPKTSAQGTGSWLMWAWVSVCVVALGGFGALVVSMLGRDQTPTLAETTTIIKKNVSKPSNNHVKESPHPNGDVAIKADLGWNGARTLTEGLVSVSARHRVVLHKKASGDWDAESIVLGPDGIRGKDHVHIVGEPAGVVIFAPTDGKPMLTIRQTVGLVIKDLIIDGGGNNGPLVVIAGDRVDGCRFENVVFRNYGGPAVRLLAARGLAEAPIQFQSCTFTPKDDAGDGLEIGLDASDPSASRNIVVSDCLFVAHKVGVMVAGPLQSLVIQKCRFGKGKEGIRVAPGPAGTLLQKFTCKECVFADHPVGVLFQDAVLPAAQLVVSQSLFVRVPAPVVRNPSVNPMGISVVDCSTDTQPALANEAPLKLVGETKMIGTIEWESTNPREKGYLKPKLVPPSQK